MQHSDTTFIVLSFNVHILKKLIFIYSLIEFKIINIGNNFVSDSLV